MLAKIVMVRLAPLAAALFMCALLPTETQALTLPAIDPESLPNTNFSCIGKVIGGYYADVYTGCQMFHVCTLDEIGEIHDYKFGCILGTVFDQETRVCERSDEVDCSISESFFHLNDELYGPGIIPPTADTAATSSAATVQVLDPSVALLAATISPPASTDTPNGPSSAPANPSTFSVAGPPPPLPSQSIPTSSPPPPVIPPGVTASSASTTSRMSTSTSSSVTAAYSFPPLPFTVSRTSTSVSASSRVRIETPLLQISLNQGGFDLPAPHLRPSLLRLAAQAQNSGQHFDALNPTSPSPVTSRTPADFEDVPRLSFSQSSSDTNFNDHSIINSRQKRQTTSTSGGQTFRTNRVNSVTEMSDIVTQPLDKLQDTLAHGDSNQPLAVTETSSRKTSRGRNRFESRTTTQASSSFRDMPLRTITVIQNTNVRSIVGRQRAPHIRSRQNGRTVVENRLQEQNVSIQSSQRPVISRFRQQVDTSTADKSSLLVKSQQDIPILEGTPLHSSHVSFVRPTASSQPVRNRPNQNSPVIKSNDTPQQEAVETFGETLSLNNERFDINDPLPLNDPTPLPPVILTAELPPDSIHRVSEGATSATDFPTTTQSPFVFPETSFQCHDKVPGGLYADIETGCVVFHICSVGPDSSINDNKFVCGEGTLFDQKSRTCQAAVAVDCSISESLYYVNDRLKGPEKVVDLCLSHPLGTPLANLANNCMGYVVCEKGADGGIGERHYSCKKDYLFSQMQKQCLPSKKVNCIKETLSGILGLNLSKTDSSKKRVTRSLLSHRLRRAALPPLINVVKDADLEDAHTNRALLNLATLKTWTLENARDTAFIEVYTLNTKNADFPKKVYGENPLSNRYVSVLRKKRDVVNATTAEQALHNEETKIEEPLHEVSSVTSSSSSSSSSLSSSSSSSPTEQRVDINPTATLPNPLPTITIPPLENKHSTDSSSNPLLSEMNSPTLAAFNSPSKIAEALPTTTVTDVPPRTTATQPVATVTVTSTVTVELSQTETPGSSTALPSLSQSPVESSTLQPLLLDMDLNGNTTKSADLPTVNITNENSPSLVNATVPVQSEIPSEEPKVPVSSNSSATHPPQDQVTDSLAVSTTVTESQNKVTDISDNVDNITTTAAPAATNSSSEATLHRHAENTTAVPTPTNSSSEAPLHMHAENTTAVPSTTTQEVELNINGTSKNETASVSTTTTSDTLVGTADGGNSSTTEVSTPSTDIEPTTPKAVNLPETNFTCKDKKLEQFYPDIEADCRVFHYCSPGFEDRQILDLKFLCTGNTMFDVNTQKCENNSMVRCGGENTTQISLSNTSTTEPPATEPPATEPPTTEPFTTNSSVVSTTEVVITTEEPQEETPTSSVSDTETTTSLPDEITTELGPLEGPPESKDAHINDTPLQPSSNSTILNSTNITTPNTTTITLSSTPVTISNITTTPTSISNTTTTPTSISNTTTTSTSISNTTTTSSSISNTTTTTTPIGISITTTTPTSIYNTTTIIFNTTDASTSTTTIAITSTTATIPTNIDVTTTAASDNSTSSELSTTSSSPQALNNTNTSISIMNESTIEVSKSNITENPL